MGQSNKGQICYGILFEEDYQFPWDKDGDEIDDWWIWKILKFKHTIELFDENGNFLNGIKPTQEQLDYYFNEIDRFKSENEQLPVTLINCCSNDYPIYILTIPCSIRNCDRGEPFEFNPKDLIISEEQKEILINFCKKYNLEMNEPRWYLSSFCD